MADTIGKFDPKALEQPLFVGDIRQLQNKFTDSNGLLKEYWEDFQRSLDVPERRAENLFLDALFHDRMRRHAVDVGNESHAAGVVFPLRIIQTLSTWHGKSDLTGS